MRLNTTELHSLRSILGAQDPAGRIYLYGSRVNDQRRGGDIDVYLQASRPIDLLIKNPGQLPQPIHQIAAEQGVLL